MRRGDLVKIVMQRNGASIGEEESGTYRGARPITRWEVEEWYESKREEVAAARVAGEDTFSITMNDAGESRLPPTAVGVTFQVGEIYTVLRARTAPSMYYRKNPGHCEIICTKTGRKGHVLRKHVEVVGS
jgi:hypothetical protein